MDIFYVYVCEKEGEKEREERIKKKRYKKQWINWPATLHFYRYRFGDWWFPRVRQM